MSKESTFFPAIAMLRNFRSHMNALPTLRSLPPLAYLFLIGWILAGTGGFYSPWGVILLGAGLAVFACTFRSFKNASASLDRRAGILLFPVILIFYTVLLYQPNILYPQSKPLLTYFRSALFVTGVLLSAFFLLQIRRPMDASSAFKWFIAILCAFFYLRFFVLSLSPLPFIDVFTSGSTGADYLLGGLNPYTQPYQDIYEGASGYPPGFLYSPVYLFLIAPFRLLHDIRLATIAADALTLAAVWRLGSIRQWNVPLRVFLILLWLCFPVSLFVLEQSWVDPLLIAASAWTFVFLLENKLIRLGLALGLLCGIKLYGVIAAFLALIYFFRRNGFRPALKCGAIAAALLLLAHLPFLYLDAGALIQSTWTNVIHTPLRPDALTLWSALGSWFDFSPAKSWATALTLPLICLVFWNFCRSEASISNLTRAAVLIYSLLFFFGYQAFCNYYYYLAFLVFLDFILSFAQVPEKSPSRP